MKCYLKRKINMHTFSLFFAAFVTFFFGRQSIIQHLNVPVVAGIVLFLIFFKLEKVVIIFAVLLAFVHVLDPFLISIFSKIVPSQIHTLPIIQSYLFSIISVQILASKQLEFRSIIKSAIFICLLLFFFEKYIQYDILCFFIMIFLSSYSVLHYSKPKYEFFNLKVSYINLAIAFLLFLMVMTIDQSYKQNLKVVLLESQWCITSVDYKDDYTMKSAYSYSIMKNLLSNKYDLDWVQDYAELPSALCDADVLLLITPTKPFSDELKEVFVEFVDNGGRIVAIADHTDLYGHANVLNSSLSFFGLAFRFDSIFSTSEPMVLADFYGFRGVDKIHLKTPCSLEISRPGHVWATVSQGISERGDYAKPNFFGDLEWSADDIISEWPIGATVPYGSGEVTAFCDSTIFANFAIFQPGNLEILDGLISGGHYSSRAAYWALCLTCLLILICRKRPIVFLGVSLTISIVVMIMLIGVWHSQPDISQLYPSEKVIDVYGDPDLIVEPPPNSIPSFSTVSSLYAHIARSGLFPRYRGADVPKSISNKTLVFIDSTEVTNFVVEGRSDLIRLVIVGEIDPSLKLPFKPFKYGVEAIPALAKFMSIVVPVRTSYHVNGFHSVELNGVRSVPTFGALDDRTIGNWWINNDISPYRRKILDDFYGWLHGKNEIKVYRYPTTPDFTLVNDLQWRFATDRGAELLLKGKIQDQKFIYLGTGVWGVRSILDGKQYLLGGPELLDNSYSIMSTRWAAVSSVVD